MALVICSNPLGRTLDASLVEAATELAQKSIAYATVCDWISIYKACLDINDPNVNLEMYTKYVNELEALMRAFVKNKTIAERKISFSSIFKEKKVIRRKRPRGGTGRRSGLKIRRPLKVMGVQIPPGPLD